VPRLGSNQALGRIQVIMAQDMVPKRPGDERERAGEKKISRAFTLAPCGFLPRDAI
jgi:hypothetical protein